MDVNQLCLFLFVTLRLTEAIQTYVEYEFNFECGKQPVTGELIVEKGISLRKNRTSFDLRWF